MPKLVVALLVVTLTAFAVSCKTASTTTVAPAATPAPAVKAAPVKTIVDYKNKDLGGELPEWVTQDIVDIEAQAKYKDSYIFRGEAVGGSEAGAKMLATQMDADTQIARMISLRVQNLFTGAQVGDDKNMENYMENLVKSMAEAKVTGWRNVNSFWVQYEYAKDKHLEYRYFVLFSIPKETVKQAINDALGKAPAPDTKEKQIARDKVRAMTDASLPAMTAAQSDSAAVGK